VRACVWGRLVSGGRGSEDVGRVVPRSAIWPPPGASQAGRHGTGVGSTGRDFPGAARVKRRAALGSQAQGAGPGAGTNAASRT
jgi:hypothetical protein